MTVRHAIYEHVARIARDIAGPGADAVDRESRFPRETIDALKQAKALSCGIPRSLGGLGLNIGEQGALCIKLAEHCASASMVFGMHLIKVASLAYHSQGSAPREAYLRDLVAEQRLVASATSEHGVGGNLRNSIAAVEMEGGRYRLVKHSPCLAYGAHADDIFITCRRRQDSPASDQVVVLATRDDYQLEQTGEWDALGMRGTCSPPFTIRVAGPVWQIFERPFADIATRTMVPESYIIWSCIWYGVAKSAVARARAFVQAKAQISPEVTGAARRLALLGGKLQMMYHDIDSVTREYVAAHEADDTAKLASVAFGLRINNLKVNASEHVREIVAGALDVVGFPGYLNNTEFSIARHLRDAYSAVPMIGNDRLVETNALWSMVHQSEDP